MWDWHILVETQKMRKTEKLTDASWWCFLHIVNIMMDVNLNFFERALQSGLSKSGCDLIAGWIRWTPRARRSGSPWSRPSETCPRLWMLGTGTPLGKVTDTSSSFPFSRLTVGVRWEKINALELSNQLHSTSDIRVTGIWLNYSFDPKPDPLFFNLKNYLEDITSLYF